MKLGFLTACLPQLTLTEIADWASVHHYEALEVAVWPDVPGRPFEAHHIDITTLDESIAEEIRGYLAERSLEISALAYYENNLHPDASVRALYHEHLRRAVDAAVLLNCPFVGTFVGRDWNLSVRENVMLAEKVLPPLVDYATERGVKLIVENCPMEGWHPDGYPGNLAYSPELWEWMFSLGFYLNYDPSHLTWLGIEPISAMRAYPERIVHAQAKDVETDAVARNRYGSFGRALDRSNPWDNGWYQYRVPGRGAVDWTRIVDTLYQIGFDGTLSVEHEDPIWSGDPERVFSGLAIANDTLRPLIRRVSIDALPSEPQ
ncbi:MAG: sugar phosphate isomerase/epimerase [Acidimicrobiales bacterium]